MAVDDQGADHDGYNNLRDWLAGRPLHCWQTGQMRTNGSNHSRFADWGLPNEGVVEELIVVVEEAGAQELC